jgi:hypothetical protein
VAAAPPRTPTVLHSPRSAAPPRRIFFGCCVSGGPSFRRICPRRPPPVAKIRSFVAKRAKKLDVLQPHRLSRARPPPGRGATRRQREELRRFMLYCLAPSPTDRSTSGRSLAPPLSRAHSRTLGVSVSSWFNSSRFPSGSLLKTDRPAQLEPRIFDHRSHRCPRIALRPSFGRQVAPGSNPRPLLPRSLQPLCAPLRPIHLTLTSQP